MSERRRLDQVLVERGLVETRAKARAAIEAGLVTVDGRVATKPAEPVAPEAMITADQPHPWVSRGGVKLAHALDTFGVDPAGRLCLDIGASTGGFTDVLLARGAAHVVAVDVGSGQLHHRLRSDPRVTNLERTDARSLAAAALPGRPALLVADVSFIGVLKAVGPALPLLSPGADVIVLVKPQFEVGPAKVGKGGIVDRADGETARDAVVAAFADLAVAVLGVIESPIRGGDGNVEWLVWGTRT